MHMLDLGDLSLHWREDGDPSGAPVVFANSLGTDFRLWDKVVPLMPKGLRLIRYDKRGHGLSSCPPGPYGMGALVRDAERLLDALGVRDCVFVGLSIGGMIAQGLAVKRLRSGFARWCCRTPGPSSGRRRSGPTGSRRSAPRGSRPSPMPPWNAGSRRPSARARNCPPGATC
ncbi:MAG: alpha/beta fold hydrolase [Defluviimonas denitrificans]